MKYKTWDILVNKRGEERKILHISWPIVFASKLNNFWESCTTFTKEEISNYPFVIKTN